MNNTPLIDSAIRLVELAKHLARIDKQIKNGFEKGITFGGTYEGGVAFPSEFTGLDETFALEIAKEIRDGIRKQICQELANYSKLLGSK